MLRTTRVACLVVVLPLLVGPEVPLARAQAPANAQGPSPAPAPAVAPAPPRAPLPPCEALADRMPCGTSLGDLSLRELPSSRTLWSLVETVDPFSIVDRMDNAGLYLGDPGLVGSHGSSWTQAGYSMDGLDMTDPARTGRPLALTDPQVLEALRISSAFAPVEFGGAGTTMELVPQRPGPTWRGDVMALVVPHALQATNATVQVPSIAESGTTADISFLAGGPLVRERVSLLVSGRLATARRFEGGSPLPLDSSLNSLFLHAIATPSADNHVRIVASLDGTKHPFSARARFPDRNVEGEDGYWHLHGIWEHLGALGIVWSGTLGVQRVATSLDADAAAAASPTPLVATIERLRDGPVPELATPGNSVSQRYDAVLHTSRDFVVLGRLHSLVGSLSFTRAVSRSWLPAFTIAELDDGLSARAWYFQATGESHRQLTEVAVWGQDNLAVTPRLFLNLGVRFEATSASARNNPDRIAWRSFSPRASVRYQVSDALSACGGYSMYQHRLPLDYLAYGDQSAPFAWIHRWDDRNGDAVLQPSEVGPLVANLGPGRNGSLGARIDPNLQRPRTDEFLVGGEARLGSSWVVRLFGIERRMRWLVAPVDVGVTLADYTPIDVFDRGADFLNPGDDRYLTVYNRNPASFGRDRYLLTNPPGHDGHYLGIDASFERRFDGRWFMLLGGSAHRSDGLAANRGFRVNENDPGVLGELFENPNALTYARGRLFFDRGYVIKWSGGFVSTHDWHLSAVARYQDGQHFTRMVLAPNLNQGPELVQAYTRGHTRFMFTFTLDAKLEKGLRIGSQRLGAVLEVFNLLNTGNEVEEDPVTTRTFRAPVVVQPPRAIRLGLRFDF